MDFFIHKKSIPIVMRVLTTNWSPSSFLSIFWIQIFNAHLPSLLKEKKIKTQQKINLFLNFLKNFYYQDIAQYVHRVCIILVNLIIVIYNALYFINIAKGYENINDQ